MTESNEREPMTFTCQQFAPWWCAPGKCPMWCGLGRCQPVFAAHAAAPQAQPSEQQVVDGRGCYQSQAQPAPAERSIVDPTRSAADMRRFAALWRYGRKILPASGTTFDGWLFQLDMLIDSETHGLPFEECPPLARSPEPAPISDAEIDKIAAQQWGHATDFAAWRRFARAVLAEKGKPPCA